MRLRRDVLEAKRMRILAYVVEYDRPWAPSVGDVSRGCGIPSRSTAAGHLKALREMGLVDWDDGKSRTLHATEEGIEAVGRWRQAGL